MSELRSQASSFLQPATAYPVNNPLVKRQSAIHISKPIRS
jgi:hypothetical protein